MDNVTYMENLVSTLLSKSDLDSSYEINISDYTYSFIVDNGQDLIFNSWIDTNTGRIYVQSHHPEAMNCGILYTDDIDELPELVNQVLAQYK